MIVFPAASITRSTPAVLHVPTQAMRLPFTRIVPDAITARLFSVMMRAFVIAIVPVGTARGADSLSVSVSVLPLATWCT